MGNLLHTSVAAVGLAMSAPAPATAYPIDCAILLCLAGGFPSSAECSAAQAEFIRRITPWPIEPPLQLWNCPMRSSGGISVPGIGADGLTADVRKYRDGIEIYHVQHYRHKRGGDNEYITDITSVGEYQVSGDFRWVRASYQYGPPWLAEAAGGITHSRTIGGCRADDRQIYGQTCRPSQTATTNDHNGHLRGVFIRFQDHTGAYHIEGVHY